MKIIKNLSLVFPLIFFLIIWEYLVYNSSKLQFLFGSPSSIFNELVQGISSGILLKDTGITALETIIGFLIGNIFGSLIGLMLWYSKIIARIVKPYITALGSIPIFSLAPMMIIWFGTGIMAKIIMAAISTIVVAIVQAYEGAKNVDEDLIKLLRSFGASKLALFTKVIVPSSLIWVISSYKLNIGFALLGAFIGEFISSDIGLGHRILKAGGLYNVPQVLAAVFCIIFLALTMSWLIGLLDRFLFRWKNTTTY